MSTAASDPPAARRGRLKRGGLLALASVPFVAAFVADFPLCPSAGLFDIPCPGCGLTRATLTMVHGHFAEALVLHPLVFVLSPIYAGAMIAALVDYVRGPSRAAPRKQGGFTSGRTFMIFAIMLLVLTLGIWLARFFGAFGGPVQVQSYGEWGATR
jgi:hypothetical protein